MQSTPSLAPGLFPSVQWGVKKLTHPKWIHQTVSNARRRATKASVPFDLTVEDLVALWDEQKGLCYWFNVPMGVDPDRSYHPCTPSLDRVVPDQGYMSGNVVWTCLAANVAKRDTDPDCWEDFLSLVRACLRPAAL